ncbi:MAG: hypothetical protein A4E58_03258 [Syntrophorhabdus sp. PtaB.Bin006]|nr:MAG: hypothetical protein A4E58_03258 [Syntrophorhabdus sp. PtaB.Bin006]
MERVVQGELSSLCAYIFLGDEEGNSAGYG